MYTPVQSAYEATMKQMGISSPLDGNTVEET